MKLNNENYYSVESNLEYMSASQFKDFVKENCERYDLIKKGIVEPVGCGHCPSCRKDLKVTSIVSYETLYNKVREEDGNQ